MTHLMVQITFLGIMYIDQSNDAFNGADCVFGNNIGGGEGKQGAKKW
jgi:hypothetical protein